MSNISDAQEDDLIDRREFKRRNKEFMAKHAEDFGQLMNIVREKKPSFGEIVERNAIEYADNVALKFEDLQFTYKEFNEWTNRYDNYFTYI